MRMELDARIIINPFISSEQRNFSEKDKAIITIEVEKALNALGIIQIYDVASLNEVGVRVHIK